jgi:hypothetical protein
MIDDDDQFFLPAEVWPVLANKLWHATHITKALSIVADGAIRPDAAAKYETGYCRGLGGVSLFDFRGSEKNASDTFSRGAYHWLSGHGVRGEDEIGVWFDIDPVRVVPQIPADEIFRHWLADRRFDEQGQRRFQTPMPYCEACYIGTITLASVRSVLLVDGQRLSDHETVAVDADLSARISEFRDRVRAKPPLPPTLADLLRGTRATISRTD